MNNWSKNIIKNFNNAAIDYDSQAELQKYFALLLARQCSMQKIPYGIWTDFGSGTGILAKAIEELYPKQKVIRVDGSSEMLLQDDLSISYKLWDLNRGIPPLPQQPSLIASNFALHWLQNPSNKIKEWLDVLIPEGLLAFCVPILGSFSEWQTAANNSGVRFTALPFPSQTSLLNAIPSSKIKYQQVHSFTQQSNNPIYLLKSIVKIGAQSTPKEKLNTGELRKLIQAWPKAKQRQTVSLTWLVLVILAQK